MIGQSGIAFINDFTPQWDDWAFELAYDYEMSGQCPTFDMNPPNSCACANTNTQSPQGGGGPTCTTNADCPSYAKCTNGECGYYNPPIVVTPTSATSGESGGNQTNLITEQGEFINRRTGNPVPAGLPYHTHEGQAMAGAMHVNTPHDKYDRVGGNQLMGDSQGYGHMCNNRFGPHCGPGLTCSQGMCIYLHKTVTINAPRPQSGFNYEQGQEDSVTSDCIPCTQDWGCPGDWSCQGGCCNPRPTIVRPKWYEN